MLCPALLYPTPIAISTHLNEKMCLLNESVCLLNERVCFSFFGYYHLYLNSTTADSQITFNKYVSLQHSEKKIFSSPKDQAFKLLLSN